MCDAKQGISWAKNGSIYTREYRVRNHEHASAFRRGEEGGGGEDRAKRGVNATWKRCKLENSVVNGTLSFVLVGIDKESVEFYRETEGAHNVFIVAAILTIDQQSLHDFA